MKYNYIIIGGEGYYDYVYSDLNKYKNIIFFPGLFSHIKNKLRRLLQRLYFSAKVNRYIKLPYIDFFYKTFLFLGEKNAPICYLFFEVYQTFNYKNFITKIKGKNESVKFIFFLHDILSSIKFYLDNFNDFNKYFYFIYTYDRNY